MNIPSILICPECKSPLDDDLHCTACPAQYSYKWGVYNIVSQNISANQTIYWNYSDEQIVETAPAAQPSNAETPDWVREYYSLLSPETIAAERLHNEYMNELIKSMTGTVCDLATGMGGNLSRLLDSPTKDFQIVCTDISDRVLAMTRKTQRTDDTRVQYIATDGRCMSVKDGCFDYITSLAAFGNIPESDKVAKELYRILKSGGKLIIQGLYIDKDSKSFELAKSIELEKGMVEEYLIAELKNAGFGNVESIVVAKAIWAENKYDMLPVAGDMKYFCVIQAMK